MQRENNTKETFFDLVPAICVLLARLLGRRAALVVIPCRARDDGALQEQEFSQGFCTENPSVLFFEVIEGALETSVSCQKGLDYSVRFCKKMNRSLEPIVIVIF